MNSLCLPNGDKAKNFSLKVQNDKTFDFYENMEKRALISFTARMDGVLCRPDEITGK
jgi:peroxiredoxin